jgi:dienelactone hydrolase
VVIAVLAAGCGGDVHASLSARTASGLADAPVSVTVHAPSGATLHASRPDFGGHVWRSSVPLRAGTTTLRGFDGTRFLWAMQPPGPAFEYPGFLPHPTGPGTVTLSVTAGGKTLARTTLSRRLTPPSVRVRHFTVRRDGIEGFLYMPELHDRRPAAVVFGGSEGGDYYFYDVAAMLAGHGYPALSLAYFDKPGLPRELARIPLEYFARAVRILRRQPGVDPAHVAVIGDSRGGEAALLLAGAVREIERRLNRHRFRFVHHGLVYPHAGHFVGEPLPFLPSSPQETAGGGTPGADEAAREDLWSRILRYFAQR